MPISIPTTSILGVNVSAINMEQALGAIDAWIEDGMPRYVCVSNVHSIMESWDDPALRRIHNEAGLVTPDGMPLVWVNRQRGHDHVRRVYGPDLMLALCEHSVTRGYRHFLYGGGDGVADLLAERLQKRYPGLNIVGTYTPPFRALTPEEDAHVVALINQAKPDVVWVGLGMPRQEQWMHAHVGRLAAPVLIGVGAAFDFHAGLKPQAPRWMQQTGLEWLFRLMTEPSRLWQRYLRHNPRFAALVLMQALGLVHTPNEEAIPAAPQEGSPPAPSVDPQDHQHAEASGRRYALLYHRRRATNAAVLGLGDGLALTGAMLLAGTVRWWLFGAAMVPVWSLLLLPGWWLGAWVARLLPGWGLGAVEELRRTMTLLTMVFVGVAVALFLSKQAEAHSRLTLSLAYGFSIAFIPYARTLIKKRLIKTGRWGLPAALYGGGKTTRRVIQALREEPGIGYTPTAVFADDQAQPGSFVAGVPVLGDMRQCAHHAPIAILALPDFDRARLPALLEGPLAHYKQVVLIPDLFEIPTLWVRSRDIAGVLGLEITSNLLDPLARFLKRAMDLALVLLAAPLWLPLCLALALAIRLEDGAGALYFQERIGKNGALFKTIKFRTMAPDAEQILQRELDQDPALRAEWEQHFKLRQDPRITRIGAWLRATSLDELPQLVNVLRGEMSLVGPRPLPAYHQHDLPRRTQQLRTRLRPGLTGLWQISGRSDLGNQGFERWDAYYVRNWSVWLDLVILFRTIRAVLQRTGAY